MRFLPVALAVVELEVRLYGIGMGDLAAFLLLLGDIEERLRVGDGKVGVVHLAGGGGHAVKVLHHGADEAAGGEIGAGVRGGLSGHGAVVVGAFGGGVEIGVSGDVVVIDMDAVVGNEGAARRAIGLGVDVLAEAVDRGQQRSLGLFGVLTREQRFDIGVEGLLAVFLRARHSVLEG